MVTCKKCGARSTVLINKSPSGRAAYSATAKLAEDFGPRATYQCMACNAIFND